LGILDGVWGFLDGFNLKIKTLGKKMSKILTTPAGWGTRAARL
jgi:hypothetical protein